MMLPPPTFRSNVVAVAHPSMYATHLEAVNYALSSHVTTKYVTNSYTYLGIPSPQHLYAEKSSSTRAAEDQICRYLRRVIVYIQVVV